MTVETVKKRVHDRMKKSLEVFSSHLAKVRTGRAHVSLLDSIGVQCYGTRMPLSQVATVSVADAFVLLVSVWDRQNVSTVEIAIRDSDLGVNPVVSGQSLRITLPPLSEERRRELSRVVSKEAEEVRVAVRNIRREGVLEIRNAVKEKRLSEDEGRRLEQSVQKITDEVISNIESTATGKQKEIMTI